MQFNSSISDAGAIALAQALHHNSTLKKLDLSDNDGIGEDGTHQLVQSLKFNSMTCNYYDYDLHVFGGLELPKRCEQYAIQCTNYHTVEEKLQFW